MDGASNNVNLRLLGLINEYKYFTNNLKKNIPSLNYSKRIKPFFLKNNFLLYKNKFLLERDSSKKKIQFKLYNRLNLLRFKQKKTLKVYHFMQSQFGQHLLRAPKRLSRNMGMNRRLVFLNDISAENEKFYMRKTFFNNFFRFSSIDQNVFFKIKPQFYYKNKLLNYKYYLTGIKSFLYKYGTQYRKYLKKNAIKFKLSFSKNKRSYLRFKRRRISNIGNMRNKHMGVQEFYNKKNYILRILQQNAYESFGLGAKKIKNLNSLMSSNSLLDYNYKSKEWKLFKDEIVKYSRRVKTTVYKKLYLLLFMVNSDRKKAMKYPKGLLNRPSAVIYKLLHLFLSRQKTFALMKLNRYFKNIMQKDLWLLKKRNNTSNIKNFSLFYSVFFKIISKQRHILNLMCWWKFNLESIFRINCLILVLINFNLLKFIKLIHISSNCFRNQNIYTVDILKKMNRLNVLFQKIYSVFYKRNLFLKNKFNYIFLWYSRMYKFISYFNYNLKKNGNNQFFRTLKKRSMFSRRYTQLKFFSNYIYKIKNYKNYGKAQVDILHSKFRFFFKFFFKKKFKKKSKYKYQRRLFKSRWFMLKKKLQFFLNGKKLYKNNVASGDINALSLFYFNYLNYKISVIMPYFNKFDWVKTNLGLSFFLISIIKQLYNNMIYHKSFSKSQIKQLLIRLKYNYLYLYKI